MIFRDLSYALRILAKNPGFAAVAVCSLGIGIGATSGIYSFADALILRPLPVAQPSSVLAITSESSATFKASNSISYPDYVDLRDRNRVFEGLVADAFTSFGFATDRAALPRVKFGMLVSGNFFQVLGVTTKLGRTFRADEDAAPGKNPVVVLSHDLWKSEFNQSPDVCGRSLWLNGAEYTIIGVAAESFTGLGQLKPGLYVPLAMSATLTGKDELNKRDSHWLEVRGRLKQGMGIAQANADIQSIAAALRSTYPKDDESLKLKTETEFQLRAERSPPDMTLLVMLSLLALCVLLVACANVTGLLLSRAAARSREMALRLAVGAGRSALVRQLMIENLLLALAGGVVSLGVAYVCVQYFGNIPMPTDIPFDVSFRLDQRVLLFTMAAAVFSTLFFGLTPALNSARVDLTQGLKERDATASRKGRLWGRNAIVAGQVALSLLLLIISAVMVQGFRGQIEQGPGFRVDKLQLMTFDTDLAHYTDAQRDLFYKQLLDRTKESAGVESAALATNAPLAMGGLRVTRVAPDGHLLKHGEEMPQTFDSVVSPDYFRTMAIPIVRGRGFLESDKVNAPLVAIVNEQFALHYWPNQNPLGKRIRLNDTAGKAVEVVGVAKTTKYLWITESATDYLYLPMAQNPQANLALIVQSKQSNAAELAPVLRKIVQSLDPNMPVFDVRTMANLYETRAVATPRILTQTVMTFGLMGLVLSVIGLYGVVSYSVSRRSREFGIRMALGADRNTVMTMVLKQGVVLGCVGIVVGVCAGILATRAITSMLLFAFPVGVMPFVVVSFVLLITVLLAGYAPARRASLIDPMRSLREE